MKRYGLVCFLLVQLTAQAQTQTFYDKLASYRQEYKLSLMRGNDPLSAEDTGYLRFFDPDPDYCVRAEFIQLAGRRPFLMNTRHGGVRPSVEEYGTVYFNLKGGPITLHVYRFLTGNDESTTRLFIPFTDMTNYKETFMGGRYIDVSADSIINNEVVIDFNRAYNPHTAYRKKYPYILPPSVNSLHVEIHAGEKIFGHHPGY